jgi:hypothetical protein
LNTLPEPEHKPRIFLCYAKEDKPRVKELYHQPKAAGYHPWLDEEDLLPGQDWELEVRHAIRGSDFFLACLSEKSVDKRGYVQKELKLGLDELDRMPEGNIYLIPVRLERCQVPERLRFEIDPTKVMQPIFDSIWNAAGWPRSMNYDEAGEWGKGINFLS